MKLDGRVKAILAGIEAAYQTQNTTEARRLFKYLYEIAPLFRIVVSMKDCGDPDCPVHGPLHELAAEEKAKGEPEGVRAKDLLKTEATFKEFMDLLPSFARGIGKRIATKQIYILLEYLMEQMIQNTGQRGSPEYAYIESFVAEGLLTPWDVEKRTALPKQKPVKQLTSGTPVIDGGQGGSVNDPMLYLSSGVGRVDAMLGLKRNEKGDTMDKLTEMEQMEQVLTAAGISDALDELEEEAAEKPRRGHDDDEEEDEEEEQKSKQKVKGKMAQKQAAKTEVANVVHEGMTIVVPKTMTKREAIMSLMRQMKYEEEEVSITETINGFPFDAAHALSLAVQELYGWLVGEPTPPESMFDSWKPPQLVAVEVSPGKTKQVLWGSFSIPSIDGKFQTKITRKDQHLVLNVVATVKRKHEKDVARLAEATRRILHEQSIFRSKAFKLRFVKDEDQDLNMPEPKFMDLSGIMEEELIYSEHVLRAIRTNLYTPIERTEDCQKFGIPTKRGVLLAGDYGTGKTLAAHILAKKSEANGWTFILCQSANDLAATVDFASQYQPAVVFCEDVDQVVSGKRNVNMNDILNVVDGIESKNQSIMVVFTTNEVEEIHGAMLRPGRLDAVIHVERPDAPTVEKLLRHYGRGLIPETEDLTTVSERLAGSTPAIIRECVERSKLSAVALSTRGVNTLTITAEALEDSEITMKMHRDLLEKAEGSGERDEYEFAREAVQILGSHVKDALETMATELEDRRLNTRS